MQIEYRTWAAFVSSQEEGQTRIKLFLTNNLGI